MRYNHLLLDIDGTLIGTEGSPLGHDYRLKRYLDYYIDNGGEIGLVTGRSEYYASAIYEFLGLNGVRIVEMGAGIIMPDNQKIHLASLGKVESIDRIREFLKDKSILEVMVEEPKSFMISLILPEFPNHDPRKLRELYNRINKEFEENFPMAKITVDDHSIDIYNVESDKGRAIKYCMYVHDIFLLSTAIIGDSRGDYSGFRVIGENNGFIGYVGADKNFAKELKKQFIHVYISKRKRSNGVVEIIKKLLKT